MLLLWILCFVTMLNASPNKLCVNCKYYIPNGEPKYAKCSQYIIPDEVKKTEMIKYLVTGVGKEVQLDYRFCFAVRYNDELCGMEGKKYIPSDKS